MDGLFRVDGRPTVKGFNAGEYYCFHDVMIRKELDGYFVEGWVAGARVFNSFRYVKNAWRFFSRVTGKTWKN